MPDEKPIEGAEKTASQKELELQKVLQQKEEDLQGLTENLQVLLNDPEVAKIIDARRQGKTVKVQHEETEKPVKKAPVPKREVTREDVDSMSNSEFSEYFAEKLEEFMEDRLTERFADAEKKVGHAFGEMRTGFDDLKNTIEGIRASDVVEKARAKFPHFRDLEPDIKNLLKEKPHLDLESAYFIVKGQKQSSLPSARELETERPTRSFGGARRSKTEILAERSDNPADTGKTHARPRKSFRDLVADGYESYLENGRPGEDEGGY